MFIASRQPTSIHKSSSVSVIRTSSALNSSKIVFNPSEFQVGQSKIQKLPERIITRRNSQPNLPRTQKLSQTKQPKQLQISLLQQINQKLSKQNSQLKKQIELYKKINKSSLSKRNSYLEESSRHDKGELKKLTIQKINLTKTSSRFVSDSETALYSSKEISYGQFQSITQIYNNLLNKSIKPSILQFQEQLKKLFKDMQQNFKKAKLILSNLDSKQIKMHPTSTIQCQSIISSLTSIFQTAKNPTQSKKSPPNHLIQKSRSKVKVQRQLFMNSKQKSQSKQKQKQKQEPFQVLSSEEVIQKFQKYILKILRSQKIIKLLKSNLVVRKFTKKLSEI